MTARSHRAQGWASAAIGIVAALAVGAGLAIGAGPAEARKERRDDLRRTELGQLADQVRCLAADGRGMPSAAAATPACPGPWAGHDPLTGAPYRFEPIDDEAFRLCADFELPPSPQAAFLEARYGDCIIAHLPPSGREAPAARD